jgi:hypothetical protein
LKAIEAVQVGDLVLARDEDTGEAGYRPVVELIAGDEREIWEVTVETTDAEGKTQSERIGTTEDHPWRTAAGAWLETKDLTPGTELVSADGDRVSVIAILKTDRIEPTYNFEVEGFHTYFVGEGQVWVHNICQIRLAEAGLKFPHKVGRYELHHIIPKYLGGAGGPVIKLPAEYHQMITNAFREAAPYGQKFSGDVTALMRSVYGRFPII